jgi:hypothetical protein
MSGVSEPAQVQSEALRVQEGTGMGLGMGQISLTHTKPVPSKWVLQVLWVSLMDPRYYL